MTQGAIAYDRSVLLALSPSRSLTLPAAAQSRSRPTGCSKILASKVLRVGTTMDTPVFSMRNPASGQLEGFDMDALATLGQRSASRSNT